LDIAVERSSSLLASEMLDWLSSDQRGNYAESQILDAPETPAPVFAYRALKGVLFGSYDDDDDENEKENIPLQTRSSHGFTNSQRSPLRPSSSTPQRPTPRRMLSPAKSILRTPGIPTPRRQNASVKFKDSKQTSMCLSTIAEGPTTEDKASPKGSDLPAIAPSEMRASTEKNTLLAAMTSGTTPESEPETYYNVAEIDAYIAATEREMKKLVRYGQRMREYARLSQKENATLKRELDAVRKENEMLRHRDGVPIIQPKTGRKAHDDELFDLSPPLKSAAGAAAIACLESEPKMTQPALGGQRPNLWREETAEKILRKPTSPNPVKRRTEEGSDYSQPDMKATTQPPPAASNALANNMRVAPRIQLPADKVAAAKARLRVKSEERRKALSMTRQVPKEDHGSSVVDWQDL
jgi:hypothetical protein